MLQDECTERSSVGTHRALLRSLQEHEVQGIELRLRGMLRQAHARVQEVAQRAQQPDGET